MLLLFRPRVTPEMRAAVRSALKHVTVWRN